MAIGILTGHYTLNRHQIIIGATDSPLCRRCMESEETHTRTYIEVWQINGQIYIYIDLPINITPGYIGRPEKSAKLLE